MQGTGRRDAAPVAKASAPAGIKRPPFEGDVSEWGKTQVDSFYDEDAGSEMGPEVSEISSGISPRDKRPRARPFDLEGATQVCQAAEWGCRRHHCRDASLSLSIRHEPCPSPQHLRVICVSPADDTLHRRWCACVPATDPGVSVRHVQQGAGTAAGRLRPGSHGCA